LLNVTVFHGACYSGIDSDMVNKPQVSIFDDPNTAADFIARRWAEIAKESVMKNDSFAVALSGGKTPALLYDRLRLHGKDLPWENTHIFEVDERFVPSGHVESNYYLMKNRLLEWVPLRDDHVHTVITEGVTLKNSAEMYEKELENFFSKKNCPYTFDLIMLGIGEDGHTASLFPFRDEVKEHKRLAIPVIAEKFPHQRISLTLTVINNARNIIFFVAGKSKAKIMKEIVEDRDEDLPAAKVRPRTGKMMYVLDAAAASFLRKEPA
jgi:6-phosphogluconolactonase